MFCSSCGTEVQESSAFCPQCGARTGAIPLAAQTSSQDIDKILVMAAHLGGIFFGFIPALMVYLIRQDRPGWVLDNAREALNWQITVMMAGVASIILAFILIGFFMFWALMLANFIFCIVATFKTSNHTAYRYPWSFRLLK